MTVSVKKILFTALCAVIGLALGLWFLKGLWTIAPVVVAGIVGGFVASFLIKGPEETIAAVRATIQSATNSRPRETDIENVFNQSRSLNQRVRFEDGVSVSVLSAVEEILDLVEGLAPPLCLDFEGDELTYNVCRVATYQLPRLLDPYFKVKPADRASVEPNILKTLEAVRSDLAEIQTIFRDQGIDAVRHRAKTVEMKFSGIGGNAAAA